MNINLDKSGIYSEYTIGTTTMLYYLVIIYRKILVALKYFRKQTNLDQHHLIKCMIVWRNQNMFGFPLNEKLR